MNRIETHPLQEGFVPEKARCLIMGTFPPIGHHESMNFFFYPSPQNHFWNRMEHIFPEVKLKKTKTKLSDITSAKNVQDKKEFSMQKGIGFLDVFTKISRSQNTNDDTNLVNEEDVLKNGILIKILERNPSIQRICCTYSLAFRTLKEGLAKNGGCQIVKESKEHFQVFLTDSKRELDVYLLYPATRSRQKKEVKDEQYRRLIFGGV